tara:strand:- start:39 stop:629 length:591 start_codon:yes stop_codon:yes gene_type:complete
MSEVFYPFQFPVYYGPLDNSTFDLLKKDVLQYINQNYDHFHKPWNCNTKSSYNIDLKNSFKNNLLEKIIYKIFSDYCNYWEFETIPNLSIEGYWVNIAKKDQFQETHAHIDFEKRNVFSGVIYINIPEDSGNLILENPLNLESYLTPNSTKFSKDVIVTPQEKLFIIFPSWLKHLVGVNNSNQNRISISFNIKLKT